MSRAISESCLVCGHSPMEFLFRMHSYFCPGISRDIALCMACGHVQLSPLFGKEEYQTINDLFFSGKYLKNGMQNPINLNKRDKLDTWLSPYLQPGLKVLDVGSGEGWALDFFRNKNCRYHAIEAIPHLADQVNAEGGTVIGKSLFQDFPDHSGTFDVVLCRHVLEHLPDPRGALLRIRLLLRESGVLCLAVPNLLGAQGTLGLRTHYFRPVHLSYFCETNLLRLVLQASFEVLKKDAAGEIFMILKSATAPPPTLPSAYAEVRRHLLRLLKEKRFLDFWNHLKIRARVLLQGNPFRKTQ